MKIKIDGDLLAASLKSLQNLVQAAALLARVTKGYLCLVGTANGNSAELTVPCTASDKDKHNSFSVDLVAFATAIAKRKEVTLNIQENVLRIHSGSYVADLLINQYEPIEVIPESVMQDKSLKMKEKFLDAIRAQLPKLELKPLMAIYDSITLGIKATPEGTFVACFDNLQSAFYVNKELKGNFELIIPSSMFSLLARELKGQAYQLLVSEAAVYAYNDNFKLALALQQQDNEQIPLDAVIDLFKATRKNKEGKKLVLKSEGIKALLENAKAIYEKDCVFTFKAKGKECLLELKSSFGNIKSKIMLDEAIKGEVEFSCDFGFFKELLAKAPNTLELNVTERLLMFSNKPVTYLLSLV